MLLRKRISAPARAAPSASDAGSRTHLAHQPEAAFQRCPFTRLQEMASRMAADEFIPFRYLFCHRSPCHPVGLRGQETLLLLPFSLPLPHHPAAILDHTILT